MADFFCQSIEGLAFGSTDMPFVGIVWPWTKDKHTS